MKIDLTMRMEGEITESIQLTGSELMSFMGFINKRKEEPQGVDTTIEHDPEGDKTKVPQDSKSSIDINELRYMYVDEDRTAKDCAAHFGIGLSTFNRIAKENGIQKERRGRPPGNNRMRPLTKKQFVDKVTADMGLE